METTPYPTDPEHLQEVVALQSAGLVSCVESMSHVTESLVSRMHQELAAADRRVKDSEIADPLTGVFNRREIDRQIEARKAAGESPILLHFLVAGSDGALTDQLLNQSPATFIVLLDVAKDCINHPLTGLLISAAARSSLAPFLLRTG